jgi:hypothetical protein
MRRASETFRLQLMQEHDADNLNAITVKAHPDVWHKELMDKLDLEYKRISDHQSLREQKLALRAAALDNVEMLSLYNIILEQEKNDLIYFGRLFFKVVELEDIMTECIHLRALAHFSTLSFVTQSRALGDDGDWLSAYNPFIELATRQMINEMLQERDGQRYSNLYKRFKDAADEMKIRIVSGKYISPKNITSERGSVGNGAGLSTFPITSAVLDLVRGSVEETLNALLEAEADELCQARRYERSEGRKTTRAGYYTRGLHTKAGEVELKVPKLRSLPFETAIIERYRRRESSVEEALMEMYLAGVSVRRVEDITQALWGTRVSPSAISDLNQKLYVRIEEWRNRPIEGTHPYVFLDGIWLKRTWGNEVCKNVAVLVAIGVNAEGDREVLGVCEGTKEDKESWRGFLRHLKERGWVASSWSSATSAWAWSRRWASSIRIPSGSGAWCTSTATCSRRCPRARSKKWRRCSRRSTPRRTALRRARRPPGWSRSSRR